MAILNRCCFWPNVRSGSFAAGFYILILYTLILTAGVFHIDIVTENVGMLILSLVMLVFSGLCVITSILLLIGLCVDSRALLIPWLVFVSLTTGLDIIVSILMFIESRFSTFMAVLFAVDFVVLSINVYSIICVLSQYQEYCAGRGDPQVRGRQLPEVEYCERVPAEARLANSSSVTQSSVVPAGHSEITSTEDTACRIPEDTSEENVSPNNVEANSHHPISDQESLMLVADPAHS